jgi:hypothetical protein
VSLFEIEINKDFKILNSKVFFDKGNLEKYYKLNNLNNGCKDDISEYLTDDTSFKVHHNLFTSANYRYDTEEVSNIINSNIYELNEKSNEDILYPEWIIFLIAVFKNKTPFIHEKEFKEYLIHFKYIAEIRYKQYIIRNIVNYLNIQEKTNYIQIKETLFAEYEEYINSSSFETKELLNFLNFLYRFHSALKDNENYKLMWNIEAYIIETIKLLQINNTISEIYLEIHKGMRGTYSVLHDIYKYKPLYIEESKMYFNTHLKTINNTFQKNITLEEFMNILTSNDKYEDILFSYLELLKRFNANRMSEDVMSAMIKGIVLDIEEKVKESIEEHISHFDKYLERLCSNNTSFQTIRLRIKDDDKNILLSNLDTECMNNEKSLEMYLAIYYNARNYLAHNSLDMNKFFWGEDGSQKIISNVIDAIIIIIYKLETMNEVSN